MASYTKPSISGYNDNPPTDDGSEDLVNNGLDWTRHIDEIGDPIKTFAEAVNNAADAAFTTVDSQISTLQTNTSDVGFEATNTASTGFATGPWTACPWPTEVRDPGTNFTHGPTAVDGYYIAPTDGIYQFNAQLMLSSLADNELWGIALFVDPLGVGSYVVRRYGTEIEADDSTSIQATISCTLELNATDRVKVYGRFTGTGTKSLISTSGYNWFQCFRVTNTT